jgi:hypothetical protein
MECTARRSNGLPCKRRAIVGGRVCPYHGWRRSAGGCCGKVASGAGGSAAVGVPQTGLLTFEFAVTLPGTTALSAVNDVRAEYNSALPPIQGGNLGITSQAITIDRCTIDD